MVSRALQAGKPEQLASSPGTRYYLKNHLLNYSHFSWNQLVLRLVLMARGLSR